MKKEGEIDGFSHAYLLTMDDARHLPIALKTFAKLFFHCDDPKTNKTRRIAELIDEDSFSDCVRFPAADKKLTVEDAERILEESALSPVEGDCKVFLLADFAEANVQTQNKLLKLLEEPPKGVIFLLGATSVFPVLPTVLSRTKKLEIPSFSMEEVTSCLERLYRGEYDRGALALAAAASGGNVGTARGLLEGGKQRALLDSAYSLLLSPVFKLPAVTKEVGETAHKRELLNVLRLLLRDALQIKTGGSSLLLPSEKVQTAEVANAFQIGGLVYAQEALSEAEKEVKFNAIFSQCLEVCLIKILRENEKYKKR